MNLLRLDRSFTKKGPSIADTPKGRHGNIPIPSMRKHLNTLSVEFQKFCVELLMVHACHPTGVNADKILSIAIAIHVEETEKMVFDYNNL